MAVNLEQPTNVLAVPGVKLGTASSGTKSVERDDVALVTFSPDTQVAGVYTQSSFAAAPVQLARLREQDCRAWIINSGNANAATGQPGLADAEQICARVAQRIGVNSEQVQPFSTGVIGERLAVPELLDAADRAACDLDESHWEAAARAIMTTDTIPKLVSAKLNLDGTKITVTGMAKGSGMIKPDMATMLSYVACDAKVGSQVAGSLVRDIVEKSFNRITVDGDTSTNDCLMLACTGEASGVYIESADSASYRVLRDGLSAVAKLLAQGIIRDAEGATKFVSVVVEGGNDSDECLAVAYTIAESPLVKTALFAGDANWGRLCMAIGRAPVANLNPDLVEVWLDDVQVASNGLMSDSYTEQAGAQVLAQDEFVIRVGLNRGDVTETVWTSDLSYDYVRINAEYRT